MLKNCWGINKAAFYGFKILEASKAIMNLGYGFVRGINRISKQRVQYWRHREESINWYAFLWYMARYTTIIDYDDNSFDVEIVSVKQREFFYRKVLDYIDEIESANYAIDKTNVLYKENDEYERNKAIIDRLFKE